MEIVKAITKRENYKSHKWINSELIVVLNTGITYKYNRNKQWVEILEPKAYIVPMKKVVCCDIGNDRMVNQGSVSWWSRSE